MFKAKYVHTINDGDYYWRSIPADNLREADRMARRWCKKGWFLISVVQEMFNNN